MTQWLYREIVSDQSRVMELPTIHPALPNRGVPRIMAKMGAGVAVRNGVRSAAVSQDTPIVFVVDDDF